MSRRVSLSFDTLGDVVCDVADKILRPPERLTVSQAAEKYRYLNIPGSYIGPWRNEKTPYCVEPMDVLASREYKECIFVGPSQSAKTEMLLNWLAYTVVCDPADLMIVQMSQAQARDFSMRRVDRLHRDTKAVKALLGAGNEDNVFDVRYRNGMLLSLSWPTVNELASKPVGRVGLTDYDRMPLDVGGEGTPFGLSSARTTAFGSFAMTFAESSPGHQVTDVKFIQSTPHEAPPCEGILSLYNGGDRRRWYWPCPHCEEFYEPSFKLLQWDMRNKNSAEAGESAQMACPKCGARAESSCKRELNAAARWLKDGQRISKAGIIRGDAPFNLRASFWLRGPAAAFSSWASQVSAYIEAEKEFQQTGSQESLKTVVNTKHGDPYFPRGSEIERMPEDLKGRSDSELQEKKVPVGARFLLAHVDVQKNRFVVQIHGVGVGEDAWIVDRFDIVKSKRLDGDGERLWVKPATYLEDWDLITEQVIEREYELEDGSGFMSIKVTICDSGGYARDKKETVTENSYKYWRALRKRGLNTRFYLSKGEANVSAPRAALEYPDTKQKDRTTGARGEIPVLFFNVNALKDALNARLDRLDPGGGRIMWGDWLPNEFFQELTAERRTAKGWEKINRRNEAWDLLTYLLGTLAWLGVEKWDWTKPPSWAAEWPKNSLVRKPDAAPLFTGKPKVQQCMSNFGAALG